MGPRRPLGREPHRRVDVRVDHVDDLLGGVGAGRHRGPDLGEPLPAVGQIDPGDRGAVGQRRAVPGQHQHVGYAVSSSRLRQVGAEVAVGPGHHGGAPAQDRVAGEHDPLVAALDEEAHRVGGVPGRGQHLDVQPAAAERSSGPAARRDAVRRVGGQHRHAAEQLGTAGRRPRRGRGDRG